MFVKKFSNWQISTTNGRMQRCPSLIVLGVYVGAMQYQKANYVHVPIDYGLNLSNILLNFFAKILIATWWRAVTPSMDETFMSEPLFSSCSTSSSSPLWHALRKMSLSWNFTLDWCEGSRRGQSRFISELSQCFNCSWKLQFIFNLFLTVLILFF